MSLIMDATKAAQRERERRAGRNPDGAPLLVPLRARPAQEFSWRRMVLLTGGGAVVLGAVAVYIVQTRGDVPRALRTPGPTVVSIATAPPTTRPDSAPALVRPPANAATKETAASQKGATKAPAPPPRVASSARSPSAPAAPDTARAPSAGQLRIAVEQPREIEAARLFAAGVASHRAGDLASARVAYEQALALVPTEVDALNNLGVLYLSQRDYERAEALLRRVLALAPGNAGAWNNLGTVLRERGRSSDAIAAFQRALALEPAHQGARVSLAQQYLVIGALAQARRLLEEVLVATPNAPEANYALGQVLERQGDRVGAIRAYTAFMRAAPPTLAPYVDGVRRRVDALGSARP